MSVIIRRATQADLTGLVQSSIGLFTEDAGTRDPTMNLQWPRVHAAHAFTESIADESRLVLVADSVGTVVGHLTASLAEPTDVRPIRVATLASLYVFPEVRNERVGAQLVAACREWAKEQQADRLRVSAYAANTAAIRFYERQGFTARTVDLETPLA